ncbi:MAG TPA: Fur family transcriptional regulator [Hyphomicrobiales bacterium]|nr:Fur family transcriptional regulator [Hyphomicrobiales bacterium]
MPRHSHGATRTEPRTPNQRAVLACLAGERRPLTAYQLLDRLRGDGIAHPPTVYRALNDLMRLGLVHRVESLNGFVACDHGPGEHRAGFAICRACSAVEEVELAAPKGPAVARLAPAGFAVERISLEFAGLCAACAAKGEAAPAHHPRP